MTDFQIDTSEAGKAVLSGVMRLESPEAYEKALAGVREGVLASASPYLLDLRKVVFLNSSGIRTLGSIVLLAAERGKAVALAGDPNVPWQKKTFASFQALHPSLELRW